MLNCLHQWLLEFSTAKHTWTLCSLQHLQLGTICGTSFWSHPRCCNHDLNHLMCMAWTLKHKEGLALGQPVLASQTLWIACRMEIVWSTSCLRRKWDGVGGGTPRLGWWLWGKGKHPGKVLKILQMQPSPQLLFSYCVPCTTKEVVW